VVVVHGASPARAEPVIGTLQDRGCDVVCIACGREPDLTMLEAALSALRGTGVSCIVAIGGGSVIDLGKAVAALMTASGPPLEYLEGVGQGRRLDADPLPFVAVPTTAGTGAEVTRNAVIGVPAHRRKVSLRDHRMFADVAIVDPALTDDTPRGITLASGLDAITQVIEPFVCNRATPLTDAVCRDAIPRGLSALARLMAAEDRAARDDMALVSLFGGIALSNAGLGAVHGLAGVIGGVVPQAPHGAVCGVLLPHVLAVNAVSVGSEGENGRKIEEVRAWIASALGAASWAGFAEWTKAQGLPTLSEMGVRAQDHRDIAVAAGTSSSIKANPVALSVDTLVGVLEAAG
jgi:alcohol dehydrogenase class IV